MRRDTDRQIVIVVDDVDETIGERDLEAHLRIPFLETGEDRRQHCLAEPCGRADPQSSLIGLVGVHHIPARIFKRLYGRLDLRRKNRTVRRQRNLPRGSDEKLDAKIGFQRSDGACHRGRRHVEFAGHLGEIPLFGGEQKDPERFVIVHLIISKIAIQSKVILQFRELINRPKSLSTNTDKRRERKALR
ncbi:hypothetical protein D3C73_888420 [compost metagenome]